MRARCLRDQVSIVGLSLRELQLLTLGDALWWLLSRHCLHNRRLLHLLSGRLGLPYGFTRLSANASLRSSNHFGLGTPVTTSYLFRLSEHRCIFLLAFLGKRLSSLCWPLGTLFVFRHFWQMKSLIFVSLERAHVMVGNYLLTLSPSLFFVTVLLLNPQWRAGRGIGKLSANRWSHKGRICYNFVLNETLGFHWALSLRFFFEFFWANFVTILSQKTFWSWHRCIFRRVRDHVFRIFQKTATRVLFLTIYISCRCCALLEAHGLYACLWLTE